MIMMEHCRFIDDFPIQRWLIIMGIGSAMGRFSQQPLEAYPAAIKRGYPKSPASKMKVISRRVPAKPNIDAEKSELPGSTHRIRMYGRLMLTFGVY